MIYAEQTKPGYNDIATILNLAYGENEIRWTALCLVGFGGVIWVNVSVAVDSH